MRRLPPLVLDQVDVAVVSEWIARGSVGVPFMVTGAGSFTYSYSGHASGTSNIVYTLINPFGTILAGKGTAVKSLPRIIERPERFA